MNFKMYSGLAYWSVLLVLGCASLTFAQTTAFTYQGKLTDAGNPANGNYDMQFKLFDTLSGGAQQGMTITNGTVAVNTGIFTVTLDFGANAFTGAARYLEIGVRPTGSANPYTLLAPRQVITSSPYAIQTLNAQQLNGLPASRYVSADVTGNVGIGTSSPGAKLDVQANLVNGYALFSRNTGNNGTGVFGQVTGAEGSGVFGRYDGSDSGTGGWGVFGLSTTGYAGVFGSGNKHGMFGQTANANYSGVYGKNDGSGSGVFGQALGLNSTGVFGRYDGGNTTGANGWGVFGLSPNGYAGVFGSGGKNGVFGATSHPTESGVYGKNDGTGIGVTGTSANGRGIYGRSFGDGDGVVGETGAANRSGVYGLATNAAGCGGCFQNTAGGPALGVAGNAVQSRDGGGLVKAMAYVDPFPPGGGGIRITRCYNSQVTTPDPTGQCNIRITSHELGKNVIDFGFPINDRFVSVIARHRRTVIGGVCQDDPTDCMVVALWEADDGDSTPNEVTTVYLKTLQRTDVAFHIIVY